MGDKVNTTCGNDIRLLFFLRFAHPVSADFHFDPYRPSVYDGADIRSALLRMPLRPLDGSSRNPGLSLGGDPVCIMAMPGQPADDQRRQAIGLSLTGDHGILIRKVFRTNRIFQLPVFPVGSLIGFAPTSCSVLHVETFL